MSQEFTDTRNEASLNPIRTVEVSWTGDSSAGFHELLKKVISFIIWKRLKHPQKPALERKWFWDMDYDRIDRQASYKSVVARIIERGGPEHWEELIRFYGRGTVVKALKREIVFLPDYAIEKASSYFCIENEEMLSYIRKQSKPGHWI